MTSTQDPDCPHQTPGTDQNINRSVSQLTLNSRILNSLTDRHTDGHTLADEAQPGKSTANRCHDYHKANHSTDEELSLKL